MFAFNANAENDNTQFSNSESDRNEELNLKGTVGLVSLGCSKNRVDSEQILGLLEKDGYSIVSDPAKAEIIIISGRHTPTPVSA